MSSKREVLIDGQNYSFDSSLTIIQACEEIGIEIPRFCYHERLSIAGNCRMCLVEVVGGPPKPVASCAMQIKDLRPGQDGAPPEIKTKSKMVKDAREGVMEFLLINHPLDCPICDQGGECDLQDQAVHYGIDFTRYFEPKRAVDDINLGPLVETHMTRCISCTRCVRFTTEVAGIDQMGQTGRGEDSEITSYLNQTLNSELQGNIIDLCPVGALTSKPYAFTARSWELKKTDSIDVMDALGSNIRIDTKGREVKRILPRNNDEINEEWISDKTRFVWDGLKRQRLDKPYIRINGKLTPVTWNEAFDKASEYLKDKKVLGIVGDLVNCESIFALKDLVSKISGDVECRLDNTFFTNKNKSGYLGNATIEDIDFSDEIIIVGSNPKLEAPVLNARIRKAWLNGSVIKLIGENCDLTYDYINLGNGTNSLKKLISNKYTSDKDKRILILGSGALRNDYGENILNGIKYFCNTNEFKLLILHTSASKVGAMSLNFVSDVKLDDLFSKSDVIYNLGADEIEINSDKFVIYQGSHGDKGANRADIIFPGAAYTEENGIFVNTEGRAQLAKRANFPPGEAKENWSILRALSNYVGKELEYNDIYELRRKLFTSYPDLEKFNHPETADISQYDKFEIPNDVVFKNIFNNFYNTNPIARASLVLNEMFKLSLNSKKIIAAE